ncbi:hypothetical protein ACOME3_009762 [Neoechinorhynchus agilis]
MKTSTANRSAIGSLLCVQKRINTIQDAITPCLMIVISKEDIADPNCISDCDCCTRSLKRVIQSFNEIECVVSCSSRLMADIAHVFYRAQKSFFYPTRHLIASYHPLTFNDQFISILQHVFFLMSNFHDSFNKDRLELSSFIESQPHLPDSIQLDQFYKIIKDSIVNLRPERAWSIIEVFYERNLTFHNHLVANKGYTEKQLIDFILSVDFNDNYERIIRQYRIAAYFNQLLGPKRNLYVVASHLLSLKRLSEQDFEEFLGSETGKRMPADVTVYNVQDNEVAQQSSVLGGDSCFPVTNEVMKNKVSNG